MTLLDVPLDQLQHHPLNSNAMPAARFEALVGHLARTGRYPPLIVRPLPTADGAARYQLLDGHHRLAALRRLGHPAARCDVWDVTEPEALLLLATLNRLEGEDDPHRRGDLLAALRAAGGEGDGDGALEALSRRLPDSLARVRKLLALREPPPPPRPAPPGESMPVAVHFFLRPAEHRELLARLRAIGGTREAALMSLVRQTQAP